MSDPSDAGGAGRRLPAGWLLGVPLAAFVAVAAPVVVRGGLLADDYNNCLAPKEQGLGSFLSESMDRLGLIRPARFVEILLTTGVCERLPFGVAIAVPAVLTVAVAFLLRGLLRDLGTARPWPEVAAGLWLLQPLGTEAALWPAALHVPLGLTFGLVALRLVVRGRGVGAAAAAVAAVLCVEQLLLVLVLLSWSVAPAADRRRTATTGVALLAAVALVFALVPGSDPRLDVGAGERLRALVDDIRFLVEFPAVGLGLHSGAKALAWAAPWSVAAVVAGVLGGWSLGPRTLPERAVSGGRPRHGAAVGIAAVVAANLPVLLSVPHQGSPRVFTPTWLVLCGTLAWTGARVRWPRRALAGAVAGGFAAIAVLSLALSASVRLRTADFNEAAAELLAARTDDGDVVAVCGVRRTVVDPAPRGAFAVHELIADWSAADALKYHAGRRATFELAGELWPGSPCSRDADVVVEFDELVEAADGG